MASKINITSEYKIVNLLAIAADAAGRTGAWISLKNAHKAFIVCDVNQGNAATVLLTPRQASAVAGTGSKVLTNVIPIWADQDTATSDALVAQTAAVNFTTSAGTTNKIVVFEIDPSTMDVAGGFDCVTVTTGASNAANITGAKLFIQERYAQSTPPSAIVD